MLNNSFLLSAIFWFKLCMAVLLGFESRRKPFVTPEGLLVDPLARLALAGIGARQGAG
jgi:hypothetical protein